uniref:Uncharacterized protein n=1 Tax=Lotharella oceanica TaxID=641309 RepID=A0A7S2TWC5_9EUKA
MLGMHCGTWTSPSINPMLTDSRSGGRSRSSNLAVLAPALKGSDTQRKNPTHNRTKDAEREHGYDGVPISLAVVAEVLNVVRGGVALTLNLVWTAATLAVVVGQK